MGLFGEPGERRIVESYATIELTPDVVFEILASPRRQQMLSYLSQQNRAMDIDELATVIATKETGTSRKDLDEEAYKRVLISLHHVHVPKLMDVGLIERVPMGELEAIRLTDGFELLKPDLQACQGINTEEYYTT